MGALLVLVLALTFSVGAVSAYVVPAADIHNINIVDGSVVLTEDVAVWPATVTGNFVDAETAYGVLRTAYAEYNVPYDAVIDFETGSYYINSLDGTTAPENYYWLAFVNGVVTYSLNDVISNNTEVAFLLTNDIMSTSYSQIANSAVADAIAFQVTVKPVNTIYTGTYAGNGMTGQQVLQALNGTAFTVDISEPTPAYDYAWLNSINGISKNWTKTGCGFAVLKNNQATDALNKFTVNTGDVLKIWMVPSTYGGTWTGHTATAGYYLEAPTDTVTITIT